MWIILQHITWPHEDDDDDYSLDTKCRISGYLRHFIENGMCTEFESGRLLFKQLVIEIVQFIIKVIIKTIFAHLYIGQEE